MASEVNPFTCTQRLSPWSWPQWSNLSFGFGGSSLGLRSYAFGLRY